MEQAESVDQLPICIIDQAIGAGVSKWATIFDGSYCLAAYSEIQAVLAAFAKRKKFSLVLLAMTDISEWAILSTVCESANLPAIVMLRDDHWGEFPASGTLSTFMIDTVAWDVGKLELLWRVREICKGRSAFDSQINEAEDFTWGDYRFIDGVETVVLYRGQRVRLQRRQFLFALILFKNIRRVVSRERLTDFFQIGKESKTTSRALDVCAVNIRKKLQLNPENGLVLRAIYGRGYQLLPTADASTADR